MKRTRLCLGVVLLVLFWGCNTPTQVATGQQKNKGGLFNANIGVQAYSFRNYFPKDAIGTLDKIQEMGITEYEGGPGRIDPVDFKKLCADRGITIVSTGASFEDLANRPEYVAATAEQLGAKYVMCAWIPHNGTKFTVKDAQNAVEVFNNAGKILADRGITFCYHPHGYEFQTYKEGILLDYIFEKTDPKYVFFEMDIFWIHYGGGDPVDLLQKYAGRWKLMHMKDMKIGTKKNLTGQANVETNVPLGTGELDIPAILSTAKEIGIEHYFIEDESSQVLNQVPQSIAYLRSL